MCQAFVSEGSRGIALLLVASQSRTACIGLAPGSTGSPRSISSTLPPCACRQPHVSAIHLKDGIAEVREQTRNRHLNIVRSCQSNRIG